MIYNIIKLNKKKEISTKEKSQIKKRKQHESRKVAEKCNKS